MNAKPATSNQQRVPISLPIFTFSIALSAKKLACGPEAADIQ
jgi:hypothetical protein